MIDTDSITASARYCRVLTRRSATSFYYAFKTLPRRKRRAFEIIYAFMRISDDISDDLGLDDPAAGFAEWRGTLRRAAAGDTGVHPVMPALMDVATEFAVPVEWLDELVEGTEQDLVVTRFATQRELWEYCYKVASIVGLVSLRIFGLERPSAEAWKRAEAMAVDNGQAFQLTNVLRDVNEDLERDRIYLPQEDLERFGLDEAALATRPLDGRFRELMRYECERAEALYDSSRPLVDMVARDARACLVTMRSIYHEILRCIVAADYDVWTRRARVPLRRKLGIAARAWLGKTDD